MPVFDAYSPRSFSFLRLVESQGFKIKLYGIRYGGGQVDQALVDGALPVLLDRLETASQSQQHYGVGFACVHQGKTGNFAFIDWWSDENELHHHVYVSTEAAPETFVYVTPTGLIACVWDLRLLWFEREAWVACALRKGEKPDLDGYLAQRIEESS